MGLSTNYRVKSRDWKVASVANVGIAVDLAGEAYLYQFQSDSANYSGAFAFFGAGLGVGAKVSGSGGVSMTDVHGGLAWSVLTCDREFSAYDLHLSFGRVTAASGSFMLGYGWMYITATNSGGGLFSSQPCHGVVAGVGASDTVVVGFWLHASHSAMQR